MLLFASMCVLLVFSGFSLQRTLLVLLWGLGLVISQSFEVLVLYRKAFRYAIAVEASTTAILAFSILGLGQALTVNRLIALYAVANLLKACAFTLYFRDIIRAMTRQLDLTYFRLAAPFFLLGFSGMLASRIDLYAVNYALTEKEVAQYQVFINLMLYLQALSAFIVMPFLKNLYRMGDATFRKLSFRLFMLGIALVTPALAVVHRLLILLYDIHFSPGFIVLGGLFVLPVYAYLPFIHRLYKLNWQNTVLIVNLIGAGVNLVFNMALLPRIGINGAILASALVQWGMLVFYCFQFRGTYGNPVSDLPHPS
jgi:O-antigen/teichoic acid export membrane protein